MNVKFYDVHVFFRRDEGYSIPVKIETDAEFLTDEEVIAHAVEKKMFSEEGDENYVDTVDEITEKEYNDMKGI